MESATTGLHIRVFIAGEDGRWCCCTNFQLNVGVGLVYEGKLTRILGWGIISFSFEMRFPCLYLYGRILGTLFSNSPGHEAVLS